MIPAGRGNPYINQNPIREAYQVASLYDRAFYDQPNAQVQAQVLVNGFEVCPEQSRYLDHTVCEIISACITKKVISKLSAKNKILR